MSWSIARINGAEGVRKGYRESQVLAGEVDGHLGVSLQFRLQRGVCSTFCEPGGRRVWDVWSVVPRVLGKVLTAFLR